MKTLINEIFKLKEQKMRLDEHSKTLQKKILRLYPRLEYKLKNELNNRFKEIAGNLELYFMSNSLEIYATRKYNKETRYSFMINEVIINITYPQDDCIGSYRGKKYEKIETVGPKIEKFLKDIQIDKCI